MFKSEAKLFLSASNNIDLAQTVINECKRRISEIEIDGISSYNSCKNNIIACDIDGLANKVEETRKSLMELDSGFANEYMTLIAEYLKNTSIDTSNMNEKERIQYSSYLKDYNYNLLYMFERLEKNGQLTPEIEGMLLKEYGVTYEMQKAIVEQYDIQNQMSSLTTTSQEYIDLYKKSAEYDKKIININPNLTVGEKKSYLEEYGNSFNSNLKVLELNRDIEEKYDELKKLEQGSEVYYKKENEIKQLQINYYEGKDNLTEEEKKQLQFLKDCKQINNYYIAGDSDAARTKKVNTIDPSTGKSIATAGEIKYENADSWGRLAMDTDTFLTSFTFGVGTVTEALVDGGAMLAGGIGSRFGADTQWAEDFVSINFAGDAYDGLVLQGSLNSESAYSDVHTVGNMVGTIYGYTCLSWLPGGKATMAVTGGLSAMGSSSQRALNSGATFSEAFHTGLVSGVSGAVTGYYVGQLGEIAKGATSLLQVGGYAAAGAGVSMIEPVVNSITEYVMYANDITDANGNKVYDNLWEYYTEGGGLTNTMMAGAAGTFSVGSQGLKGYRNYKKVYNSINNLDNMSPKELSKFKTQFEQLSKKQMSDVFNNVETEITLKSFGKNVLGYTDDSLDAYVKQLKSDAKWDVDSGYKTDLLKKIDSGQSLTDAEFRQIGFSDAEIKELRICDNNLIKDFINSKTLDLSEIYDLKFKDTLSAATETLYATKIMFDNGVYTVSLGEVLQKRMDAKNKIYTPSKKIVINGKDYTSVFPGCDEIISDKGLMDYTKKLSGISDSQIKSYAKSKGINYKGNEMEAMAIYLQDNPVTIKGTIYQTATEGGKNFRNPNFGENLGDSRQIGSDYNISGGAYMLLSDDATMATKYSDCCKIGKDGKLEITDIEKFGKDALSGVPLSKVDGVYKFEVEVPLNSSTVSLPSINNGAMYTAYGVPGGYLLSGELETVISSTKIGRDFIINGGFGLFPDGKIINGYLLHSN